VWPGDVRITPGTLPPSLSLSPSALVLDDGRNLTFVLHEPDLKVWLGCEQAAWTSELMRMEVRVGSCLAKWKSVMCPGRSWSPGSLESVFCGAHLPALSGGQQAAARLGWPHQPEHGSCMGSQVRHLNSTVGATTADQTCLPLYNNVVWPSSPQVSMGSCAYRRMRLSTDCLHCWVAACSYLGSVQAALVNDTVPSLPAGSNASIDSSATYSPSSLSQVW
jgi:hypothetical protein